MLSFSAVISYYLISFWPIAALQVAAIKNVSLLLISSSSRPDSLCFGFDLNQSQRTILISWNGYLQDCLWFHVCIQFRCIISLLQQGFGNHTLCNTTPRTCKLWGKNINSRRGVGPKLFHHSNRACSWIRCQRTAYKTNWGFSYS